MEKPVPNKMEKPVPDMMEATVRLIADAENPFLVGPDDELMAGLKWLLAKKRIQDITQKDMPKILLKNRDAEIVTLSDKMSKHKNNWMTLYVGDHSRAEIKFDFESNM